MWWKNAFSFYLFFLCSASKRFAKLCVRKSSRRNGKCAFHSWPREKLSSENLPLHSASARFLIFPQKYMFQMCLLHKFPFITTSKFIILKMLITRLCLLMLNVNRFALFSWLFYFGVCVCYMFLFGWNFVSEKLLFSQTMSNNFSVLVLHLFLLTRQPAFEFRSL